MTFTNGLTASISHSSFRDSLRRMSSGSFSRRATRVSFQAEHKQTSPLDASAAVRDLGLTWPRRSPSAPSFAPSLTLPPRSSLQTPALGLHDADNADAKNVQSLPDSENTSEVLPNDVSHDALAQNAMSAAAEVTVLTVNTAAEDSAVGNLAVPLADVPHATSSSKPVFLTEDANTASLSTPSLTESSTSNLGAREGPQARNDRHEAAHFPIERGHHGIKSKSSTYLLSSQTSPDSSHISLRRAMSQTHISPNLLASSPTRKLSKSALRISPPGHPAVLAESPEEPVRNIPPRTSREMMVHKGRIRFIVHCGEVTVRGDGLSNTGRKFKTPNFSDGRCLPYVGGNSNFVGVQCARPNHVPPQTPEARAVLLLQRYVKYTQHVFMRRL